MKLLGFVVGLRTGRCEMMCGAEPRTRKSHRSVRDETNGGTEVNVLDAVLFEWV